MSKLVNELFVLCGIGSIRDASVTPFPGCHPEAKDPAQPSRLDLGTDPSRLAQDDHVFRMTVSFGGVGFLNRLPLG